MPRTAAAITRRKVAPTSVEPLDPAVMLLIDALARQMAREDHAAECARIAERPGRSGNEQMSGDGA